MKKILPILVILEVGFLILNGFGVVKIAIPSTASINTIQNFKIGNSKNLISISDNYREIFTIVAITFNESTKPDMKWSRNGFAHRLEIWSNQSVISLVGIKLRLGLIPTRFMKFTLHLIAPRCLFSMEYTVDGERLFQALAIGNIIWDS